MEEDEHTFSHAEMLIVAGIMFVAGIVAGAALVLALMQGVTW
tara:strand:- start:3223 stop:3348 length:126 start_codon:yes stop_codon:yes gene_type:complete